MANLLEISKEICSKEGLSPKKIHGQNFLIEEEYYQKIIDSSYLGKSDRVLEVGPGLGFLTERLASSAGKVFAVEIDTELSEFLAKRFTEMSLDNIELVCGDVMKLGRDYDYNKIVANLPYNISAHFLKQFVSVRNTPELMVLMLQNEVVERICAGPGEMSILAVSVQYYMEASKVCFVPKGAFWPEPKVDSAVVRLKRKNINRDAEYEKRFFQLVKIGFSSRRKMLKNNLSSGYRLSTAEALKIIKNAGLDEKTRAQDLRLGDWAKILGEFS